MVSSYQKYFPLVFPHCLLMHKDDAATVVRALTETSETSSFAITTDAYQLTRSELSLLVWLSDASLDRLREGGYEFWLNQCSTKVEGLIGE